MRICPNLLQALRELCGALMAPPMLEQQAAKHDAGGSDQDRRPRVSCKAQACTASALCMLCSCVSAAPPRSSMLVRGWHRSAWLVSIYATWLTLMPIWVQRWWRGQEVLLWTTCIVNFPNKLVLLSGSV